VEGAVRVEVYEGGHMFYTHDAPRARLARDARMLFEAASEQQRRAAAAPAPGTVPRAGSDRGAPSAGAAGG
jgi:hypothetical protein